MSSSRHRTVRRLLLILPFALVLGSVVVGGHVYLARRLIFDPSLAEPLSTGLLVALVALASTIILDPFAQRFVGPPLGRVIAWPASVWMGFAFLLLLLLLFSDLALWSWRLLGAPAAGDPVADVSLARARALAVVGTAGVAGALALRGGLRPPMLRRVEVRLSRWPAGLDGFRIVQISDLHIGPILGRRFAESVVARVNALRADVVAVTGDLADGSVRHLADDVAPFAGLEAKHGVFFVTGNHDHYSGVDGWVRRVEELGMRPLRNEWVSIGDGAGTFALAGVDDHHADLVEGGGGEDLDRALRGLGAEEPVVLLAHDPSTFASASRRGVDFQISGHTHGGQIWPFRYFVRLAVPFVAGHYHRNGSQLYVSHGTGFWGPPMRLLAPAEITEFVIRPDEPA